MVIVHFNKNCICKWIKSR